MLQKIREFEKLNNFVKAGLFYYHSSTASGRSFDKLDLKTDPNISISAKQPSPHLSRLCNFQFHSQVKSPKKIFQMN